MFSGLSSWIWDTLVPFESLKAADHLLPQSVTCLPRWQEIIRLQTHFSPSPSVFWKTAGVVTGVGYYPMMWYFFPLPLYLDLNHPVSFIFLNRCSGGSCSLRVLRDVTTLPRSPVCQFCGQKSLNSFFSSDCKCDWTGSHEWEPRLKSTQPHFIGAFKVAVGGLQLPRRSTALR